MDVFERLADLPHLGSSRDDLKPGLRGLPIKRLRVNDFYRIAEEAPGRVTIARVMRFGRNITPREF